MGNVIYMRNEWTGDDVLVVDTREGRIYGSKTKPTRRDITDTINTLLIYLNDLRQAETRQVPLLLNAGLREPGIDGDDLN